jgi:hypothetical protein
MTISLLSIAALLLLGIAGDAIVWRLRGEPAAEQEVSRVTVASMKRNKEEYFFDGSDTVPCAVSITPQRQQAQWLPPCWWLLRHRNIVTRY